MYRKLTEEEKKALEKFPVYDNKPENWVGSREYWESIFETETNRDPKLHKAFGELHKQIVDIVIQFCEEHGLEDVDEFYVSADGLRGSYGCHSWQSPTDSSMSIIKSNEDEHGWVLPDREHPFLYEI